MASEREQHQWHPQAGQDQGKGKDGAAPGSGPSTPPLDRPSSTGDHASVFVQRSTELTGISMTCPGLRHLAEKPLASGKLTISTIDSSQGGEAD
eukprot:5636682-Pyramimonas_sp.AAC.2